MGSKSKKAGGRAARWTQFAILLTVTIVGVQNTRLLPTFGTSYGSAIRAAFDRMIDTAFGSALTKALSESVDDEAAPEEAFQTDLAEGEPAETTEPSLSFDRAVSYYKGIGVQKDYGQALVWYFQASRDGFPVRNYRLSQWEVRESVDQDNADNTVPAEIVGQADLPSVGQTLGSLDRSAILRLQSTLARMGYDPGPIDGVLGPKTRAAFERSQEVDARRQNASAQLGEQVDS